MVFVTVMDGISAQSQFKHLATLLKTYEADFVSWMLELTLASLHPVLICWVFRTDYLPSQ